MAKKVLFINQEIFPYVPESPLATMGRQIPQAVQEKKFEIRTFMPKWGNINERRGQLHEVIRLSGMNIIINETDHPLIIKVASIPAARLQVYFIDNDDYFTKRKMAADENGVDYTDNGERAVFFARGVLETVKKLRWVPDVIHCQGWMAGIIPLYVKTAYHDEPSFAETKVVTSLFNNTLTRDLGEGAKKSIEYRNADESILSNYSDNFDFNELSKLAIDYSDGIVEAGDAVSPELIEYAKAKGVPVVPGSGEDTAQQCIDLYDKILG